MKILALETTELVGSVAACVGSNLLLEKALDPGQQSARSLAPAIKWLLREVGWRPVEVEIIAVTIGPGSFTGLRLGLATAKTLAYCTGAGLLGVDTLEVVASAAPEEVSHLAVAVDAQRGQVVACEFRRDGRSDLARSTPSALLDAGAWLGGLPRSAWVSGPALRRYADLAPSHVRMLPQNFWAPSATQVGRVAARDWTAGRRDDLWSLSPVYSRRSAAEEKWQRSQAEPSGNDS